MTTVVADLAPERCLVAVDGLGLDPDGSAHICLKAYPVPHASTLVLGQGPGVIVVGMAFLLCLIKDVRSIDDLIAHIPAALKRYLDECSKPGNKALFWASDSPLFSFMAFGWSESRRRLIGRTWRSWEDFSEVSLPDGECASGGLNLSLLPSQPTDADFFQAMRTIQRHLCDTASGAVDAWGTGGDVTLYDIRHRRIASRCIGRLPFPQRPAGIDGHP